MKHFGDAVCGDVSSYPPLLCCFHSSVALLCVTKRRRFSLPNGSISVMDADITVHKNLGSLKRDLIGATSFDAMYVYFNEVSASRKFLLHKEVCATANVRGNDVPVISFS